MKENALPKHPFLSMVTCRLNQSKDGVERHYRGCVGVATVESGKVYCYMLMGCLRVILKDLNLWPLVLGANLQRKRCRK